MTSRSKTSNGKSQHQVSTFIYIYFHSHKNAPNQNWGLPCNNSIGAWRYRLISFFRQMKWLEICLIIKIRNICQKKYVAVEDPKLPKIDINCPIDIFCTLRGGFTNWQIRQVVGNPRARFHAPQCTSSDLHSKNKKKNIFMFRTHFDIFIIPAYTIIWSIIKKNIEKK